MIRLIQITVLASAIAVGVFAGSQAEPVGNPTTIRVTAYNATGAIAVTTNPDGTFKRVGPHTIQTIMMFAGKDLNPSDRSIRQVMLLMQVNCSTSQERVLGLKALRADDTVLEGVGEKYPTPWIKSDNVDLCKRTNTPTQSLSSFDMFWKTYH